MRKRKITPLRMKAAGPERYEILINGQIWIMEVRNFSGRKCNKCNRSCFRCVN